MRPSKRLRYLMRAPLIYLAALLLLLEEWFWDSGLYLGSLIVGWPPLALLETRIRALAPYPALCVFILPTLLLFPVKLLALIAIASGHVVTGICVIIVAKLAGAARLARLYLLTRPALLTLDWFGRVHRAVLVLNDRWLGALKASAPYRSTTLVLARLRRIGKALLGRLRWTTRRGRHAIRPARIVRRLLALWRIRRRQ